MFMKLIISKGQLSMKRKGTAPTMKDVAKEAGVSLNGV